MSKSEKIFDPAPVQDFAIKITRALNEGSQMVKTIEDHVAEVWDLPPRRIRDQLRVVRMHLGETGDVFEGAILHSILTGASIRYFKPTEIYIKNSSNVAWEPQLSGINVTACFCYVAGSTMVEFMGRCASSFETLKIILAEETGDTSWKRTAVFDPRQECSSQCSRFESFWSTIIDYCDGGYLEVPGPTILQVIDWGGTLKIMEELKDRLVDFGFPFLLEQMSVDRLQPIPVLREKGTTILDDMDDFSTPELPDLGEDDIRTILPSIANILHHVVSAFKRVYDALMDRWEIPPLEVQDTFCDARHWLVSVWSDFASHFDVTAEAAEQSLSVVEGWDRVSATRAQSQLSVLKEEASQTETQFRLFIESWKRMSSLVSYSFHRSPKPFLPDEPTTKCCFPRDVQPTHSVLQPTAQSFRSRTAVVPTSNFANPPPTMKILDHITECMKVASSSTLHLSRFYQRRRFEAEPESGFLTPHQIQKAPLISSPEFEKAAQMIRDELKSLDVSYFTFPSYGAVEMVVVPKRCCIS